MTERPDDRFSWDAGDLVPIGADQPRVPHTVEQRVQFLIDTGHDRATAEEIVYFDGVGDILGPRDPSEAPGEFWEIQPTDVAAGLIEAAEALRTEDV